MNVSEMQKLQEQAKQRVIEMHNRSQNAVKQMQSELKYSEADSDEMPLQASNFVGISQTPKNIKMPVEYTKENKTSNDSIENYDSDSTPNNTDTDIADKKVQAVVFSEDEKEKMLLLALSLLLSQEQGDKGTILGLMYLAV